MANTLKSWEEFVTSKSLDTIGGSEKIIASDAGTTRYVTTDSLKTYANASPTFTGSLTFPSDAISLPSLKGLAFATVGTTGSGADYECDGTADNVQISLALSENKNVCMLDGTYYIAAQMYWKQSNSHLFALNYGGVTFKPSASLHPGGSDSIGRYGILTIGSRTSPQSAKLSNIKISNIIFDCDHVQKTAGLTLDGGASTLYGSIGLQNVTLENVSVINQGLNTSDVVEAGLFIISGETLSYGNKGYVDNVTLKNVQLKDSYTDGGWCLGTNITNLKILGGEISGNETNGFSIYDYGDTYTHTDWLIRDTRFINNMKTISGSSSAHFRDRTQVGVERLYFENVYFGPSTHTYAETSQEYAATPYWARDIRFDNCYFGENLDGVSIGASISGGYGKLFSINGLKIRGCFFYKCRSTFDEDSTVNAIFDNNIFYKIKSSPVYAPYSEHFPTVFSNNIVYDCHTDSTEPDSSDERSCVRINGDGQKVTGNYFIDDRLLPDPTSNLTLSSTSGGALGARTYYVKYSWANDTGESLPSSEQTKSLLANTLFTASVGFADVPTGATSLKLYVSTSSGTQTLQTTLTVPSTSISWTEPSTGLISGSSPSGSNTTNTLTKYGIYESTGGLTTRAANVYSDNYFIGIETPVYYGSTYQRFQANNYIDNRYIGGSLSLLGELYAQGNVTGATTFNRLNGSTITATLTGSITVTLTDGVIAGDTLTLILTQDGTGSHTATWPSNFKKAGGSLTLTTTAGAVDVIEMQWDGSNWREVSRSLALS